MCLNKMHELQEQKPRPGEATRGEYAEWLQVEWSKEVER